MTVFRQKSWDLLQKPPNHGSKSQLSGIDFIILYTIGMSMNFLLHDLHICIEILHNRKSKIQEAQELLLSGGFQKNRKKRNKAVFFRKYPIGKYCNIRRNHV